MAHAVSSFSQGKNSKQPNVHGCIFGCDGIRVAAELTPLYGYFTVISIFGVV